MIKTSFVLWLEVLCTSFILCPYGLSIAKAIKRRPFAAANFKLFISLAFKKIKSPIHKNTIMKKKLPLFEPRLFIGLIKYNPPAHDDLFSDGKNKWFRQKLCNLFHICVDLFLLHPLSFCKLLICSAHFVGSDLFGRKPGPDPLKNS